MPWFNWRASHWETKNQVNRLSEIIKRTMLAIRQLTEQGSQMRWTQKLDHQLRWTFAGLLEQRKQTMKAKRKRHSAAFKAKVGFEALVGLKTVSQLAREYAVRPTQVTQWRATIRDHMPELFEPGQPGTQDQEQLIAQLHQKIGQLTVDLDWLKKKSKQLGL